MIDKNTYGSSKVSEDLANILFQYNNSKYIEIVGKCLQSFFIGIKELMKTDKMTEYFLRQWKQSRVDYINNREDIPLDIRTRACNIICTRYKIAVKEVKKREKEKKTN